MDDSSLKVVSFTRDTADPAVVDYLERLLLRAKSGELRAVSVVGAVRKSDGLIVSHNGEVGSFPDRYALAGILQYQIYRIMLGQEAATEVSPET